MREEALCAPLSDGEIGIVERFKSGNRVIDAGSDLYFQGEPCAELYTLLDGWVFLYQILEDGRRQILDFSLPGAFLGFQPDLAAGRTHSAQCLTDVAVCVFPSKNLLGLFRAYPELALRMAWITARDRTLANEHLTNIGRRTARERVAHLLLEIYFRVRLGDPSPHADAIELPLTQEHIGDALGLTSVHVNRTLRQLREAGLVAVEGRTLRVLDPDTLADVAGFDSEAVLPRSSADAFVDTGRVVARLA
ncbi:MAG: Crp/Fnr family transcriptional regulator [Alphaproteobacteria bacterium]